MSFLTDIPVLDGALVRLEPLSMRHAPDLMIAAEEDRGAYRCTRVPRAHDVEEYLAGRFELADSGRLVPFAQIRMADGRAVGCTAYWQPRFWPGRPDLCAVEIGWTWLAASAQRTGINTEAKLLLFEHAFEKPNRGLMRPSCCAPSSAGTAATRSGRSSPGRPGARRGPCAI